MKWFTGDIVSAITTAKSRGAIFVVYSEGKDENSVRLTEIINTEAVTNLLESDAFVAVKIESDKEEYAQFVKIYQLVPVPSVFFIQNGIPLKIVTSVVKSADELVETITSLIAKSSPPDAARQQEEERKPSAAAVAENITITDPTSNTVIDEISSNDTEDEKREKLEKARKLIEERRVAKVKEEQRLEREREIQRRKDGQEVQNLKKWQEDQELKQLKEERMRAKLEEKAARQKILDQIEQDKRDRALKFAQPGSTEKPPTVTTPPAARPTSLSDAKQTRIQFKNPNGDSEIVNFDTDMLFADLYAFVKSDLLKGSSQEFVLATAFPRHEFSQVDFNKTLLELNLAPSSVILIIFGKPPPQPSSHPIAAASSSSVQPQSGAGGGGLMDMISSLFFGVVTPILAFFTFLRGFFTRALTGGGVDEAGKRKRDEEQLTPNEAAKRRNLSAFQKPPEPSTSGGSSPTGAIPKSGSYKRPAASNIHRLHENSDSEEDRKTWNGNSTQQL